MAARKKSTERVDVYQAVTDRVIAALESGTVPWRKPWTGGGMALSLSSKKPYRGINPLLLQLAADEKGYRSPWWGTHHRIEMLGGEVRKGVGEHGTKVVLWKRYTPKRKAGDTEDPKPIMFLQQYTVFNAEQADWPDGAPAYEAEQRPVPERIEAAEAIVKGYVSGPNGPSFSETGGDSCYYIPALDVIRVPQLAAFEKGEEYYSAVFHEFVHSTGHSTRNNRPEWSGNHFGSERYSKEELCAELGAAMLCGVAGIDNDATIENSGAYLRSWMKALADDKKLLVNAAAQAQKAADRVLGTTFEEEES